MAKEKEEKNELEKCLMRKRIMVMVGFVAIIVGGCLAVAALGASAPFYELRGDEYMDDPTIPFNERDNATYTFTDEWLSDRYNLLMWVAMPGLVLYVVGIGVLFLGDGVMSDRSVHKAYCKITTRYGDTYPTWKYCPECGLKLSRLEKK